VIERFLRLPEVMDRTGLRRWAIFDGQKKGTFPQAVKIYGRCTGWVESEVQEFIERTIAAARLRSQSDKPLIESR
jgi:prophage regulatory protein